MTGVSGSGKSTLVNDILYTALAKQIYNARTVPGRHRKISGVDHVDKVIHVDQSPIGRTPRSNPATYTGVFDHVRKLFASTPEAKMRGYLQGRFSFNVKGGRCEACSGDGTIKIEMNFLPDVYVPVRGLPRRALQPRDARGALQGQDDRRRAATCRSRRPSTSSRRSRRSRATSTTLVEVGLGYVRLGQPATTLSGGEAQRVKLASELQKRSTGRTVYVLDEPTTGLHFEDIRKLLGVLSSLVDKGNTVLVIEHNLDVIKTADWIVDMGPAGGNRGGTVVATGTPEEVAAPRGELHRRVPASRCSPRAWPRSGTIHAPVVVRPMDSSDGQGPARRLNATTRSQTSDRRRISGRTTRTARPGRLASSGVRRVRRARCRRTPARGVRLRRSSGGDSATAAPVAPPRGRDRQDLRGPGRRRQDLHGREGRGHPAHRGRLQGLQRGLHPPGLRRRRDRGRGHRLHLPRQQVLDHRRLGRRNGPATKPLEALKVTVKGDDITVS